MDATTGCGLTLDCNELGCTRCTRCGHKTRWCDVMKKEPQDPPVDKYTSDRKEPGKYSGAASVQEVRGRVRKKGMGYCACNKVGHFAANFPERRCWFCNEPGHPKRNYLHRRKMLCWTCGHFAANCSFRNRQGIPTVSCLRTPRRRRRQPWTPCCSDGEESLLLEALSECAEGG